VTVDITVRAGDRTVATYRGTGALSGSQAEYPRFAARASDTATSRLYLPGLSAKVCAEATPWPRVSG